MHDPRPWSTCPAAHTRAHSLAQIPTRLMLVPVVRSRQNDATLVPNDLLRIEESYPKQSIEHLARVNRSMPDIHHGEARNKLESLRPVGPSVARDGGFGVA